MKSSPRNRYLKNFIDFNLQCILFPLNFAMSILLFPHYRIIDNIAIPNNRWQKLKALAVTTTFLIASYLRFKYSWVIKETKINGFFISTSVYFDWFHYSFGFICLFISNIVNTENYVNLVLRLQKAFRNVNSDEKTVKNLIFWNWVSIVIIPVYYLIAFVTIGEYSVVSFLNLIPIVYFDVVVIYTIRIMWLIECELRLCLNAMMCYKKRMFKLTFGSQEKEMSIFQSYRNIMGAFDLFKKICQIPVSKLCLVYN